MSVKLRELIRAVRACKTAAEERAVITKECALCRSAFAGKDGKNRHRNVAKLLYIHMLGYPTHFAQMEALKLIETAKFAEKRIGYLGLMLLLDEKQQVLMLVTNSLKKDFRHQSVFVIGMALSSIGNIASADIARDLAHDIEKFFSHSSPYLRKKAALAAIRCIRKVPELIEDFLPATKNLINDKNHAVQLSAVTLVVEMIKVEPSILDEFKTMTRSIVKSLKTLRTYVSEYDVAGVTDPFLQCKMIRLLCLLGQGDTEASEYMNDILAEVAINTEAAKNPGYAVLYDTVMTIMSIEAENGLRVVAINILGRFLLNRDNNIRYVALNTLCKVVDRDAQAIHRHRNTIVDCLKDADISIRRRALDLIYALVTSKNVKDLVTELLNYLALTSGDKEFKADLTEKICVVVERYAVSPKWHIDTIVQVLITAGKYARPHVVTDLIALASQNKDLYAYTVHKVFTSLRKFKSTHLNLAIAALWIIGESGDLLVSAQGVTQANIDEKVTFEAVSESEVLGLVTKMIKHPLATPTHREYGLTCLIKLSSRFSNTAPVLKCIGEFKRSMVVELQQRAVEYTALSGEQFATLRAGVLGRMPVIEAKPRMAEKKRPTATEESSSDESGDSSSSDSDSDDEEDTSKAKTSAPSAQPAQPAAPNLMDMFANPTTEAAPAPTPTPAPQPAVNLMDLLGGGVSQPAPQQQQQPQQGAPDLAAMFGVTPTPQPVASSAPQYPPATVHQSGVLTCVFNYSKNQSTPHVVEVKAVFTNKTPGPLSNFEFQIACPKFLVLNLHAAASNVIPPNGTLAQSFTLTNNAYPQKQLLIRTRMNYVMSGNATVEQAQISQPWPN